MMGRFALLVFLAFASMQLLCIAADDAAPVFQFYIHVDLLRIIESVIIKTVIFVLFGFALDFL